MAMEVLLSNVHSSNLASSTDGKMQFEKYRIASFRSISDAIKGKIRPLDFAKKGFYVDKQKIVCYFCKKEVDFSDDDLGSITSLHESTCFMTGNARDDNVSSSDTASLNVPLRPSDGRAQNVCDGSNRASNQGDSAEPSILPAVNNEGNGEGASEAAAADWEVDFEYIQRNRDNLNDEFLEYMKYEKYRILSFADFVTSSGITKEALAAAGFFYLGELDRTQCAFCKGVLRSWEPGDSPREEHKRHFRKCPFINGLECGNVPLKRSAQVVSYAPKNPDFADESQRLKTFWNWPRQRRQSPEILVKAGFFYTGVQDHVKCFWCDGGLRLWESNDDPFEEHARWFPLCPFINKTRGEDFVRRTTSKFPSSAASNKQTPPGRATKFFENEVRPKDLNARMDSDIVQQVLKMGFSEEDVRATIDQRLRATGDDFANGQSLVEAVLSFIEREEEKQKPKPAAATAAGAAAAASGGADPSVSKSKKKKNKKKQKKHATAEKSPQVVPSPAPAVNTKEASPAADTSAERPSANTSAERPSEFEDLVRENTEMKEARLCKVCMDKEVNTVFLPCGHLVCCSTCSPALRDCPVCRALIKGTVRVFVS